ncbi:MAG: hypothetical protein WB245_12685 [Acidimicrobiia bacterium]
MSEERSTQKLSRSQWLAVVLALTTGVGIIVFGQRPGARQEASATTATHNLRSSMTVDGVSFLYSVPASGWERFPDGDDTFLLAKSTGGPQGAEAIVFWAGYPDGALADPCLGSDASSRDRVAIALADLPGTELVSGPSDTTIGGLPAKHVSLIVREDAGCDPGFFYHWKAQSGGAMWTRNDLGDTIDVWLVDLVDLDAGLLPATTPRPSMLDVHQLDHPLLVVAAETHLNRADSVVQEVGQIVESILFSWPEPSSESPASAGDEQRTRPGTRCAKDGRHPAAASPMRLEPTESHPWFSLPPAHTFDSCMPPPPRSPWSGATHSRFVWRHMSGARRTDFASPVCPTPR